MNFKVVLLFRQIEAFVVLDKPIYYLKVEYTEVFSYVKFHIHFLYIERNKAIHIQYSIRYMHFFQAVDL